MKKMSMIVLLIIVSILIGACKKEKEIFREDQHTKEIFEKDKDLYADIELEEIDYSIFEYEEVGTYKKDVIPDKETAIAVAVAIYNSMEKGSNAKNYEPQIVYFDKKGGIWIVNFWKTPNEKSEKMMLGDCCSIAMQKKDGRILRIWFGE